mgnify:CR=1 FL=1
MHRFLGCWQKQDGEVYGIGEYIVLIASRQRVFEPEQGMGFLTAAEFVVAIVIKGPDGLVLLRLLAKDL